MTPLRPVTPELGGKFPALLLEDARPGSVCAWPHLTISTSRTLLNESNLDVAGLSSHTTEIGKLLLDHVFGLKRFFVLMITAIALSVQAMACACAPDRDGGMMNSAVEQQHRHHCDDDSRSSSGNEEDCPYCASGQAWLAPSLENPSPPPVGEPLPVFVAAALQLRPGTTFPSRARRMTYAQAPPRASPVDLKTRLLN